jgi:hypothetical protein
VIRSALRDIEQSEDVMMNTISLRTISTGLGLLAACALLPVACSSAAHVLGEEPDTQGTGGRSIDDAGVASGGKRHETGGRNGAGGRPTTGGRSGSGGASTGTGGFPILEPVPEPDGGVCPPVDEAGIYREVPSCENGACTLSTLEWARTRFSCGTADGGPAGDPTPDFTYTRSIGCGRESYRSTQNAGRGLVVVGELVFDQATGQAVGMSTAYSGIGNGCGITAWWRGDPTMCPSATTEECHRLDE